MAGAVDVRENRTAGAVHGCRDIRTAGAVDVGIAEQQEQ